MENLRYLSSVYYCIHRRRIQLAYRQMCRLARTSLSALRYIQRYPPIP